MTPRTLPIRIAPVDDEAIDSWLEAYAHRYRIPLGHVLDAVNIGFTRRPYWIINLPEPLQNNVALATGIDSPAIAGMTLSRYTGVAVDVDQARSTLTNAFPWGKHRSSRYCPKCLSESGGRWQLSWRLTWSFACLKHRCILRDRCAHCGQRQRSAGHLLSLTSVPNRCVSQPIPRCQADLGQSDVMTLPGGHSALATQQRINGIIELQRGDFGVYQRDPRNAGVVLNDVQAIAAKVLACIARPGGIAPPAHDLFDLLEPRREFPVPSRKLRRTGADLTLIADVPDATETAVAATAAMDILSSPSIDEAAEAMHWLVETARDNSASRIVWGKRSSDILTAVQIRAQFPTMGPHIHLRYRAADSIPRPPHADDKLDEKLASRLPTAMWPAWAIRLHSGRHGYQKWRLFLSGAALLIGSMITAENAARLLGGTMDGAVLHGLLHGMDSDPCWPDICQALSRLADYLKARRAPIDYRRRRRLDYSQLLPDSRWRQICRDTGTTTGFGPRLQHARCQLFEKLSGLPPTHYAIDVDNVFLHRVREFSLSRTPALGRHLDEEGRRFLAAHDIDEPLSWHPPLRLLDDLAMPNPDVEHINIRQLHKLANEPRMSIRALAHRLSTSQATVRYLLDAHPVDVPCKASSVVNRRRFASAFRTVLTADVLHQLYQNEQLSLSAISSRFGVSQGTVRNMARANGIELRSMLPPPAKDWLYTQYIDKHRTATDIAMQLGRSPTCIGTWIKKYEITYPTEDSATRQWDELTRDDAQSLLAAVLKRRRGRTMLENFTGLLAHRTMRAAATTLNLSESSLRSHIRVLERVFGDPLVFRSRRNCDMIPTPLGAQVREAVSVLQADDRW
jgi:hypothetical protein